MKIKIVINGNNFLINIKMLTYNLCSQVCSSTYPCLNGGTCSTNGTSCGCAAFFSGQRCDQSN